MKKLVLGMVITLVLVGGIFVYEAKETTTESDNMATTYEDWCEHADKHYTLYMQTVDRSMYKDAEGWYHVYKKDGSDCDFSSHSNLYDAEKDFWGKE